MANLTEKEKLLEEIKRDPGALSVASLELQNDPEVVFAHAKRYGFDGLEFASERLLDNEDIILTAMRRTPGEGKWISSKRLREKFYEESYGLATIYGKNPAVGSCFTSFLCFANEEKFKKEYEELFKNAQDSEERQLLEKLKKYAYDEMERCASIEEKYKEQNLAQPGDGNS